jgi:hypothetical protein
MIGVLFLGWFFVLGGVLIWLTHRALVTENARYGEPAGPPPALAEPAPDAARHHQRAA